MEQSSQPPLPATGVLNNAQVAYPAPSYQQAAMAAAGVPTSTASQFTYQQVQQYHLQQQQQQQQQLQAFWSERVLEIEQTTDFKNHSLPLARIKKIMKADEDVRMISAEAPVIFAKACEIFILELTLRSWINTEENKRRTLQKNDIAAAITRTDVFDFLVDIVPRDEMKEEGLGIPRGSALPVGAAPADSAAYYYVPAQNHIAGSGLNQMAPGGDIYAAPQNHAVGYMPWQRPQGQPTQEQMPENG